MELILLALLLDKAKIFSHYRIIRFVCTTNLHVGNSVKYRVGSNLVTRAVYIFRKQYDVFCNSSNMMITYLTVRKTYCIFVICLLFTPPGPLLSSRKTALDLRSRHSGEVVITRGLIFPPHKGYNELY